MSSPSIANAYQSMSTGYGYNQQTYMNNGPGLLGNQPTAAVNMMGGAQLPHQFGHAMAANMGRMGAGWSAGGFGDMAAGGSAGGFGSPGFIAPQQFAGSGGGMGGFGHQGGGGGFRGGRGGYGGGGGYNRRGGG